MGYGVGFVGKEPIEEENLSWVIREAKNWGGGSDKDTGSTSTTNQVGSSGARGQLYAESRAASAPKTGATFSVYDPEISAIQNMEL